MTMIKKYDCEIIMYYYYCEKCKTYSLDKTKNCPLCGQILKKTTDLKKIRTEKPSKKNKNDKN